MSKADVPELRSLADLNQDQEDLISLGSSDMEEDDGNFVDGTRNRTLERCGVAPARVKRPKSSAVAIAVVQASISRLISHP